jgi:hypothetical protein
MHQKTENDTLFKKKKQKYNTQKPVTVKISPFKTFA